MITKSISIVLMMLLMCLATGGAISLWAVFLFSVLSLILFSIQNMLLLGEPISEIESSENDLTLQHLKSDYVNELLDLEQYEEAVARVLRGEGYRQVTDEMIDVYRRNKTCPDPNCAGKPL